MRHSGLGPDPEVHLWGGEYGEESEGCPRPSAAGRYLPLLVVGGVLHSTSDPTDVSLSPPPEGAKHPRAPARDRQQDVSTRSVPRGPSPSSVEAPSPRDPTPPDHRDRRVELPSARSLPVRPPHDCHTPDPRCLRDEKSHTPCVSPVPRERAHAPGTSPVPGSKKSHTPGVSPVPRERSHAPGTSTVPRDRKTPRTWD